MRFVLFFSLLLLGFRDSLDDKSKTNLVQIKGRFSVTSENVDLVKVNKCTYDASLFNLVVANLIIYNRIFHYVQFPDDHHK